MKLPLILYPRTHLPLLGYKEADFKKEGERVQAPGEGVASFNTFTNYHTKTTILRRHTEACCRPYNHRSFCYSAPSSFYSYRAMRNQAAYCLLALEGCQIKFDCLQLVDSLSSQTISQLDRIVKIVENLLMPLVELGNL